MLKAPVGQEGACEAVAGAVNTTGINGAKVRSG